MKKVKKSLIAVFLLFLVFAIPISVFSQLPSNWTKLPGGTGQTLIDVAAFSSDTLFTLDEKGNISATFDGGNTWKERSAFQGSDIVQRIFTWQYRGWNRRLAPNRLDGIGGGTD